MTDEYFLPQPELVKLTGRSKPSAQQRMLESFGLKRNKHYFINAEGLIMVPLTSLGMADKRRQFVDPTKLGSPDCNI